MQDKERVIAALLAKAEATHSQEESEAFMAKAEALMVKYAIDAATLAAREGARKSEEIRTEGITFRGTYEKPLLLGSFVVMLAFSDSLVAFKRDVPGYDGQPSGKRLMISGYASDVESVLILISSLQMQAMGAMEEWWRVAGKRQADHEGIPNRERLLRRRGFIQGYLTESARRLRAVRTRVTAEASSTPGTALALLDRQRSVQAWVAAQHGPMGKGRAWKGPDHTGSAAGRRAGASADIGQSRLGGRKAIGA